VGESLDGRRHGGGVLLERGALAPTLYVGRFSEGRRNGHGCVATPRGEAFGGCFKDDAMWGPGVYIFPPPAQPPAETIGGPAPPPRHRVRFEGMFNGRPCGRGVLTWSDGGREAGEFQGLELVQGLPEGEVAGVVAVAAQNAEAAKRCAAEVRVELERRGLWEGRAGAGALVARGARPAG
jgi:hypothetical protein